MKLVDYIHDELTHYIYGEVLYYDLKYLGELAHKAEQINSNALELILLDYAEAIRQLDTVLDDYSDSYEERSDRIITFYAKKIEKLYNKYLPAVNQR